MPPSVPPSVPPIDDRPRLSPDEAAALVRELFGIEGEVRPLPSDRDQNFHVGGRGEEAYVLKVANAATEPALLEAQHALLAHLARRGVPAPRLRPSLQGETLLTIDGAQGRRHAVWMLTYLTGTTLATANPVTPALLSNLGAFLGRLDEALAGFDHPGAHRDFEWDLRMAPATVRTYLPHVEDAGRRELVARLLDRFDADVAPRLGALRWSIVHGDANDHNILVGPPAHPDRPIAGLIDFGDVVHTYTVCEVAIAAAYAMMDQPDPLAAASAVVAGYHGVFPLCEDELAVLFEMAVLRLCLSVCMSAYQQRREPDNRYLSVSERPAWALLERLAHLPPGYAHYRFRAACGLEPCPHGEAVRAWLARHGGEAAPLVRPDPRTAPVHVFDFSVSSTEWDHEALTRPGLAGDAILARLRAAGDAVGIGRYDEVRLVYTADQFGGADGIRRTLHVGLDLFQPAGAPVFAPLDGVVHSFRDNDLPLDYGPTIILTHTPHDGPPFHTLYGHLDRAALEGLQVGQAVRRGQRIGALGTAEENGGWAPHLHFQVIADMLGAEGDFPGVAPAGEGDLWRSLCPDPNLLVGVPAGASPPPSRPASTLRQARERLVGPSLSLSYRTPLHLVRGYRQHLFDADGRAYLDAVNNVPHVGHSHPHVVRAAARQMAVLNTNTRYLHENLIRYAERLTGYLPEPLRVCFFVNSGSEANDLALRLARAYTGRRDVAVLDGAYHGHLTSLIEVSPYKFDGPGGPGRAPHTHVAPLPDPYRGRYRGAGAGTRYAEHVREAAVRAEQAGGLAAFLAEPILSCGGQIVPPSGFLRAAYGHVRAAGGLCIADEVQVGFGRVGTHFWAFETQDVLPDIVTLGKPIGNGHPLGAVVTTPAIAEAFANGMEYFNTFGGNPVSCAVGLAVLDVLEAENLQSHALDTGAHLMERLRALQPRHPAVGDVRGRGLFIGVELVADPEARRPAPAQAAYAAERMKTHGILLSTDGPDRNVLKIKPPLPFSLQDADRLADTLDAVLGEDFVRRAVSA